MSRKLQQLGNVIPATAPSGGVESGDAFLVGAILCIALSDAAAGDEVQVAVEGVYKQIPAIGTEAFTDLQPLYWTGTALSDDPASGTNPFVGLCIGGKAQAATECSIKLVPSE